MIITLIFSLFPLGLYAQSDLPKVSPPEEFTSPPFQTKRYQDAQEAMGMSIEQENLRDTRAIREAYADGQKRSRGAGNLYLERSIRTGNFEAVKILLANNVDPNWSDGRGNTHLINSIRYYYSTSEITAALLEAGAKIEDKNDDGQTALVYGRSTW